jgi:hypothetical protein
MGRFPRKVDREGGGMVKIRCYYRDEKGGMVSYVTDVNKRTLDCIMFDKFEEMEDE